MDRAREHPAARHLRRALAAKEANWHARRRPGAAVVDLWAWDTTPRSREAYDFPGLGEELVAARNQP